MTSYVCHAIVWSQGSHRKFVWKCVLEFSYFLIFTSLPPMSRVVESHRHFKFLFKPPYFSEGFSKDQQDWMSLILSSPSTLHKLIKFTSHCSVIFPCPLVWLSWVQEVSNFPKLYCDYSNYCILLLLLFFIIIILTLKLTLYLAC